MIERLAPHLLRSRGGPHPKRSTRGSPSLVACAVGVAAVTAGIAFTLFWPPRPVLLWNASASSRIGFYAVFSPGRLRAGDMAVAWASAPARRLAAVRHYLPYNVPLVKHVGAVSGDRVCAKRRIIFVNGRSVALRFTRDPSGRRMPWWSGCHVLRAGEFFLLSPHARDAFDGRYFGVTRSSEIIGRASLLWPR